MYIKLCMEWRVYKRIYLKFSILHKNKKFNFPLFFSNLADFTVGHHLIIGLSAFGLF